ncbi:MAG: helix-turn-helix domain-containing protein [Thalassotalea sp.]
MNDKRLVIIGKRIKEIRKHKGISQEKLAELSNNERSYMGRIERGERNITILKIYDICSALDIDIKDLFKDKPD